MPPRTPYEEAIVAIWRDILARSDIGVFDDFFDLNGHSLHAIQVVARIRKILGVDIPVRDFFESPTVAALASVVAAKSSSERRVVTRRAPDAAPVLSFDQQRLWLENQLLPGAAYNVHGRRRLVGPLDVAVLQASVRAILARHEALRTRFPTVDGEPVQVVDDVDPNWRLDVVDLSGLHDPAGTARRLIDEESLTPFDLAEGPLFRCRLVRLSDTDHLLTVTFHHIISDGWSIGLFVRELSALYEAGGDPARADLPELPVQYRDFAVWQRGWLTGEALDQQVGYWRGSLAGAPPAITLPTALRLAVGQGADCERIRLTLSPEETTALHEMCRKHGVTVFMALLASLATVAGRWAGQSDIVIGVPIAGRTDVGTENLIGFFVNTLPLRVDLSGDPTFAELLTRVRQVALDGYAHADAPFDVLVKELQVARDPRRTPLFQVMLNVLGGAAEAEEVCGIVVEEVDSPPVPSKFEFAITSRENHGRLSLEVDFNVARYDSATVRLLVDHLGTFLRAAMDDPTRNLLDYPLQSGEDAGGDAQPAPRPTPAPHLAVQRYAQLGDRVAVVDRHGSWTYHRLDQAAERVAHTLAQRDIQPTDRLGIVRRPTAGFVAAVLGCLKAGAAFSVIEAAGPVPAQYLGVSTLLDVEPTGEVADDTVDLSTVVRDQGEAAPATRGATQPEASDWAVDRFQLTGEDRYTVLSTQPGHLLSAMTSAFHTGATLVVAEPSSDVATLTACLRDNAVSVLYANPPVLRALAAADAALADLRYVFVDNSGDLICHDVDVVRRAAPNCRIVAVYRVGRDGRPLAVYEVPDDWQPDRAPLRVPLGADLPDNPARLRHATGQPAAVGEVAEICFGDYQTGDLGRRRLDGTLEFVGKVGGDPMVDPVETVAALRDLPEVRDAVVTEYAEVDGRTTLLGYLTGPDPALGTATIRQQLMLRLPEHLIPEHLFVLDDLPLTADGEYDLGALPDPHADGDATDSYVAPRTPMEQQLVDILQELLNIERVGIHDSFFELGGFSLLATRLTTRIREIFGVELSLRDVFESPTVDRLAQLIVRTQAQVSGVADADLEALLNELEPPQG
ncbi:MAG TPA: condensation domain-containing protein [Micromonosporaceae bacterium]